MDTLWPAPLIQHTQHDETLRTIVPHATRFTTRLDPEREKHTHPSFHCAAGTPKYATAMHLMTKINVNPGFCEGSWIV